MKILVLSSSFFPKLDGAIRLYYEHCKGLTARGHQVCLVTGQPGRLVPEEELDGFRVISALGYHQGVGHANAFKKITSMISASYRSIGKEGGFDVTYAFGLVGGVCAYATRLRYHIPFALSLSDLTSITKRDTDGKILDKPLGIRKRLARRTCKYISKTADSVIFPTVFGEKLVEQELGINLEDRSAIIPTGVDTEKLVPIDKSSSKGKTILYVGGLRRRKGIDVLLAGGPSILNRFPTARFVIIGEGPLRKELEEQAARLSIKQAVFFAGRVSDDELVRWYSNAAVVAIPTFFDTYNTSIVEAMAMARPVVSTYGSSPEEIVQNEETGLLVNSGSADELANAICKIISDPKLVKRMGMAARQRILQEYSMDASIQRLEKTFQQIIDRRYPRS